MDVSAQQGKSSFPYLFVHRGPQWLMSIHVGEGRLPYYLVTVQVLMAPGGTFADTLRTNIGCTGSLGIPEPGLPYM